MGTFTKPGDALENGLKQILSVPGGAAVQFIVRAPIQVLLAECTKRARKRATAECQQCSESLQDSAVSGAGLSENWSPATEDIEKGRKERSGSAGSHVSSSPVKHKRHKKKSLMAPASKESGLTRKLVRSGRATGGSS